VGERIEILLDDWGGEGALSIAIPRVQSECSFRCSFRVAYCVTVAESPLESQIGTSREFSTHARNSRHPCLSARARASDSQVAAFQRVYLNVRYLRGDIYGATVSAELARRRRRRRHRALLRKEFEILGHGGNKCERA